MERRKVPSVPGKYTVEVRSLNGKNLDLQVRMPSVLKQKEMELRTELGGPHRARHERHRHPF